MNISAPNGHYGTLIMSRRGSWNRLLSGKTTMYHANYVNQGFFPPV